MSDSPNLNSPETVAALNDVADFVRALRQGGLRQFLASSGPLQHKTGGCDTDCACNSCACECKGRVDSRVEQTFEQFLDQREARLRELRRELAKHELQTEQLKRLENLSSK